MILRVVVALLLVPQIQTFGSADPLYHPQVDFARAHNRWVKYILSLSPASPDYRERAAAKFEELELEKKFESLRGTVVAKR